MTEWKPIETAPKDGTRILVYPILHHNVAGKRYDKMAVIAYWYGNSWIGVRAQNGDTLLTHWMPVPASPQESA